MASMSPFSINMCECGKLVTLRSAAIALMIGASVSAAVASESSPPTIDADGAIIINDNQEQELLAAMAAALEATERPKYAPSLGAGVPTGFGANWGDVMFGMSAADSDDVRTDSIDGSFSLTVGLGNSAKFMGLELSANNLSVRNFGDNWSFDGKLHSMLYQEAGGFVSVALGQTAFACEGRSACSDEKPIDGLAPNTTSTYLALSGVTRVGNPFGSGAVPLSGTFGVGNGRYSSEMDSGTRYSPFGDLGIQLNQRLGFGLGWSGVGLNANLSLIPALHSPVVLNLLFADVTDRTRGGFNTILSIGVPLNFAN